MIKITDIHDESIAEFRSLKDNILNQQGLILAESSKVVNKLINSKIPIVKLFINEESRNEFKGVVDESLIYYASKDIMQKIVGFNLHHGVIALGKRPALKSLQDLGDRIVILNGLTNPENIGSIIRNCAAFNIDSLIIDNNTCSPYIRRCVRVSMGNIFSMKIHQSSDLIQTLDHLQQENILIYAAELSERSISVNKIEKSNKWALIIGSEGSGVQEDILKKSNAVLEIPMNKSVESLNAASSSAILLYELSKDISS